MKELPSPEDLKHRVLIKVSFYFCFDFFFLFKIVTGDCNCELGEGS